METIIAIQQTAALFLAITVAFGFSVIDSKSSNGLCFGVGLVALVCFIVIVIAALFRIWA